MSISSQQVTTASYMQLAVVAVLSFLIVGCFNINESEKDNAIISNASRYTRDDPTCIGQWYCHSIYVPVDYNDRFNGNMIKLNILQHKANQQPAPLGNILLLPGGPGIDNLQYLRDAIRNLPQQIVRQSNLLVIDSRNLVLVQCEAEFEYARVDVSPNTLEEFNSLVMARQPTIDSCGKSIGKDLARYSSEAHAHDIDIVRDNLHIEKLNILSFSYGSLTAYKYMHFYPDHIGRVIIDGAINPTLPLDVAADDLASQLHGAIRSLVDKCVESTVCDDIRTAHDRIIKLINGNQQAEWPGLISTAIIRSLYDQVGQERLVTLLNISEEDAQEILSIIGESYLGDKDGIGLLRGDIQRCADSTALHIDEFRILIRQSDGQSLKPLILATNLFCTLWIAEDSSSKNNTWLELYGRGLPSLIIVNSNDPVIPSTWPYAVAKSINAHTLEVSALGHLSIGRVDCIDEAVTMFFRGDTISDDIC